MKKTVWIILTLVFICIFAFSSCDTDDITLDGKDNEQTSDNTLLDGNTTDDKGEASEDSLDTSAVCEHSFGDWKPTKQATCKEEGKQIRICSKCSHTEEETIQKSEIHTPLTDAAVAATCKDTGLTEGSHCSVCDKVLVAQTIVPKTEDHTPVTDAAVPATCKNTGLTEGSHCSVCDKVLVRQIEAPISSNHSFVSNQCSLCNLKVIEHGNVDGSISGGNNKVKYYVTGDLENYRDFEIVVYGNGEMPNFSQNSNPLWYDYLPDTVKIRIENGVTSIGKYAFYYPSSTTACNFIMSDTVKTIKSYAISLKIRNLTLGNRVETVESNGIGNVDSIYIPKSVKNLYLDILGNETYFYEGSLEEFYQIKMYVYTRVITVKEHIATLDDNFISNIHVYLQAKNISDRSCYWR